MSHSTRNRSFPRRSSQPISWHSTEETKSNTTKAHKYTITLNNPKKLNLTQVKCNTQYNHRNVKWLNLTNEQLLGVSCVCVLHCAQLLHTILHRTDLIIFPLTLQTIIIALIMSIGGKGRPFGFSSTYITIHTLHVWMMMQMSSWS